jgi:hypothetical protein
MFPSYSIPLMTREVKLWISALTNRITNAISNMTSAIDVALA